MGNPITDRWDCFCCFFKLIFPLVVRLFYKRSITFIPTYCIQMSIQNNSFLIVYDILIECLIWQKGKLNFGRLNLNCVCSLSNAARQKSAKKKKKSLRGRGEESNLLCILLRCGTRQNEWGTHWGSNSLLQVWKSGVRTIILCKSLQSEGSTVEEILYQTEVLIVNIQ